MSNEVASTAAEGRTPLAPRWSGLLAFGLATRIVVVVLGCLLALPDSSARSLAVRSSHNRGMNARHLKALALGHRRLIEPWYRWDAIWYADVSDRGYSYRPGRQSTVAFMPLLPLLIKAGTALGLDRYWVGLLVPNLAFVVGLACFGRCVGRVTGSARRSWRACILLTAFPSSFFFSAPYQESLGLALTAVALLAWLCHHPLSSAMALAGASAARLTALAMSAGLVMEWAGDVLRRRPARASAWIVALGGSLGTALFFAYLGLRFHDPMLHLRAHSAWQRGSPSALRLVASLAAFFRVSAMMVRQSVVFAIAVTVLLVWLCQRPLRLVWKRLWRLTGLWQERAANEVVVSDHTAQWKLPGNIAVTLLLVGGLILAAGTYGALLIPIVRQLAFSMDFLATLLFLGLGIHALVKRGPLWGCLVLIPVLQVLASGSTMSMIRVVLSSYPGFLDAAELAPRRGWFVITVVLSVLAQIVLLTSYVNWRFVG